MLFGERIHSHQREFIKKRMQGPKIKAFSRNSKQSGRVGTQGARDGSDQHAVTIGWFHVMEGSEC